MAIPAGTYTRVTASTNVREDLIEKITMTNPEMTPVVSSAGRTTATNTFHEWQRDALRAPDKDNAALDGDDAVHDIRELRERSELTQAAAAALLYTSPRAFQQWEHGDRKMHPAFWELLVLKAT